MAGGRQPWPCLTLFSLLVLPALLALAGYLLIQFPHPPSTATRVPYHSLAALPAASKHWPIYSEDYYPGGAYVVLPHGRVRYWMMGPEKGRKVVLIHGLSVPAIIWTDVAPALAAKGFRVLLFDLYGRGYSDAPQTAYDVRLYITQLALLMQHVRWDSAAIAGVSMGGGIAVAFTETFPQLVSRVALLCPTGLLAASDLSRTSKIMSAPLLQLVADSPPFRYYLRRLADAPIDDPIHALVRIQSAFLPGYNAAIASSLRDGPTRGLSGAFAALGAAGLPTLLVWGTADAVVPYKHAARAQALVPQAALVAIDGGTHDIVLTHPAEIQNALVGFFGAR